MGGASAGQQFLQAGLIDEMQLHLAPILIGNGIRLFENIDAGAHRTRDHSSYRDPSDNTSAVPHRETPVMTAGERPTVWLPAIGSRGADRSARMGTRWVTGSSLQEVDCNEECRHIQGRTTRVARDSRVGPLRLDALRGHQRAVLGAPPLERGPASR